MPTRIERLASNSTMYYRGDTCIEISPFTNYYLFTIYKESNDERVDDHVPLNLTNLGTVWLSFINGDTKVRIPNYKNAENVDMANGEVVFRISEEEASRILALGNNTFYISTAITDGKTSSDETVLFSGSWNEYSLAMKSSLTETIQTLNATINSLETKLASDAETYVSQLDAAQIEIENLKAEKETLSAKIIELETRLSEIDSSYIDATIVSTETNLIPKPAAQANMNDISFKADKMQVSSLNSAFKYKQS